MAAFLAIVRLTCRGAFRSTFFWGTVVLFFAAVLILPFIVMSDGTAVSLIKITLEYSLTMAAILLSISAVWLGASEITADLEDMRLQMVAVKPVPRPMIYLAKFSGIMVIHLLLLIIACTIIYVLTSIRIDTMEFAPGEKEQIEAEILTARRIYKPDSPQENIDAAVEKELHEQMAIAKAQGKDMPDDWKTVRTKTGEFDEEEIRKRLRDRMRLEKSAIEPGGLKTWTYSGLPDDLDGPIRIRYKAFFEIGRSEQEQTHGIWAWVYHFPAKDDPKNYLQQAIFFLPVGKTIEMVTMRTSEFGIAPKNKPELANYACAYSVRTINDGNHFLTHDAPYPSKDTLMVKDGKATLIYHSLDRKGRTIYFAGDGPELLVPVTGFFANYCRTFVVLALLIAAFAALGMSFSACLSLPSGIFLTLAYVIWGISSRFVLSLFTDTAVSPHTVLEKFNYYAGEYVHYVLFDPSSFAAQEKLSSGELVEISYIGSVFLFEFLIKVLPIFLLGLFIYSKRELALAGKER